MSDYATMSFDEIAQCVREAAEKYNISFFEATNAIANAYPDIYDLLISKFNKIRDGSEYTSAPSTVNLNYHDKDITSLHTGVRPGEVIIGCGKQSKDTVLSVSAALIPPDKRALEFIRTVDGGSKWKPFLRGLSSIEFFQPLDSLQREMWLWVYQDNGADDNYLEDIPNLEVEVLQIGGGKDCAFIGLGEENVEKISTLGKVHPKEIVKFFKGKPGSEGLKGRHTLIFRRGNWKVTSIYKDVTTLTIDPNIPLLDITYNDSIPFRVLSFDSFASSYNSKTSSSTSKTARGNKMKATGVSIGATQTVNIKFPTNYMNLNQSEIFTEFVLPNTGYEMKDVDNIKLACSGFTAASYKSAIQKFVRFRSVRAVHADIPGFDYPTEFVTKVLFVILLCHPGGFVPSIQRYVGGVESAFKRLMVISYEDSYFDQNLEICVYKFSIAAYLAQRVPGWKPSIELVRDALLMIDRIINEDRAFIYYVDKGAKIEKYTITPKSTYLQVTSAMIEELKSFQGDMNMIRYIVSQRSNPIFSPEELYTSHSIRQHTVVWWHLVDQHFVPEIAYFFPRNIVDSLSIKGSKPYSVLFTRIFNEVTGVNPRRTVTTAGKPGKDKYSKDFEEREFVKLVRKAQYDFLHTKHPITTITPLSPQMPKREFHFELDKGTIAGLMGSILIRGKDPALVSLHPDNPELFIAVSNPSRSMKNPILPEKREKDVIKHVFDDMKKFGVSLGSCTPPLKEMKGALLFVTEDSEIGGKIDYIIRLKSGRKVLWEEYRKNVKDVRMVENDESSIRNILRSYTKSHAQRLLSYISNRNSIIEFKHIGRDGGGTQGAVSTNDVGAYQLLNDLIDVYPSAIEHIPNNILKFKVLFGPLMWHLTKTLTKVLHSLPSSEPSGSSSSTSGWGDFGGKDTREMREYQTESVEAMAKAHSLGRKGSFINIETGRGKTKIVLEYLKWLLNQNSLPDYVIYTLPDSAIESVITEITMFGANYTIINPLKTKSKVTSHSSHTIQGCKPMKFHINLIEHDHLRLCTELPDYMGESVFVFDEVHKALRESLRTDYGLQLSNLSVEFIALTGTPIIDQNTYRLMWWLSQISPFEVTEKNFFVSAAGMISKRSVLPAKILRQELYVSMTPSEEKQYASLVPSGLGGTNANPRNEDFSNAFELCYDVITRKMVDDLLETRAFVVAKDRNHQQSITTLLLEKGVSMSEIFVISKGNSIFFTDESVESGTTPDYRYVITTQAYSTGYTLTRLHTMVTSVYPSNQATREQLDGRINRIGQKANTLTYNIYHTGLLTHTLQRYNDAKSLSDVLKSLASEIKDI